jgi:predicted amidohydrolase YtcJ
MTRTASILTLIGLAFSSGQAAWAEPADTVYRNAYVYTVDAKGSVADAVAIDSGAFVYVGDSAGVEAFIGPDTKVVDLGGRMVLPGLHDSHIHALLTADLDTCTLNGEAKTLAEIVPILAECLVHYAIPEGEWLSVTAWNPYGGNQASPDLPTIRAALDAVSTKHPIVLFGADGHHGAYNSLGLAAAQNAAGQTVGLSAATLKTDFADYLATVGVDSSGEPTGNVDEDARGLIPSPTMGTPDATAMKKALPGVMQMLAADGITSIMDPFASDYILGMYEYLAENNLLTVRATLALLKDNADLIDPATGEVDIAKAVANYGADRERLAKIPHLKADAVKLFVDGVLEGNIYAEQPILPNAAVLHNYQQPITELDPATGSVTIMGYVDPDSDACKEAAEYSGAPSPEVVADFKARNGFTPAQCTVSAGVLVHEAEYVTAFVTAMDKAGFTVHMHAIGDRGVKTAVDAVEAAHVANGNSGLPHSLAHVQLASPEEQKRIGALGIPVVFTFAWATTDPAYDLTVLPFIDRVKGIDDLYDPAHYYMQNAYPAKSIQDFGGLIVGGSDAPVDVADPRPFENIMMSVLRQGEGGQVLNEGQRIDIRTAIAAYTINGAKALNQADLVGSIETGKRADMIVLDRNLIELAEAGKADQIAETKVLLTVFDGAAIYDQLAAQ